jgi:GAF domain-containing protein
MAADRRRGGARRAQLWDLVVTQARSDPVGVAHVGAAAISVAGVDGAAVTVTLAAARRETVYASDPVAGALEELILTLGEGPGVDGSAGGPAMARDLTSQECSVRWPGFAPAAVQAGAQAMFALPLHVGGVRLGVLDLYRAQPGPLHGDELADALLLADTACALLLDSVSDRPHQGGAEPQRAGSLHLEVHQATGMIIVQLGTTAAIALARLRAHAYAHSRLLRDVAADVVARRLRFSPDTDDGGGRGQDDS